MCPAPLPPFPQKTPGPVPNKGTISFQVLYDLGSSVYSALDYGISADEERVLGPPLENLISMMITDYLDEGLGEENYSGLSKIDSIMKVWLSLHRA